MLSGRHRARVAHHPQGCGRRVRVDDEYELEAIDEEQPPEDVAKIIADNLDELKAKAAAEPESAPTKKRKKLSPPYRNAPLLLMLDKCLALGASIRAALDKMSDESRAQFMRDKGDRELPAPPEVKATASA